MSNKASNFPPGQLSQLDGKQFVRETVRNLEELSAHGKPETLDGLKDRIGDYFAFCREKALRPGVETLCLSLSVSRQTFWNWRHCVGCAPDWSEVCEKAHQVCVAFIEAASLSGHINPATAIFALKNWANYSDTQTVELLPTRKPDALGVEDLPKLGASEGSGGACVNDLPVFDDLPTLGHSAE